MNHDRPGRMSEAGGPLLKGSSPTSDPGLLAASDFLEVVSALSQPRKLGGESNPPEKINHARIRPDRIESRIDVQEYEPIGPPLQRLSEPCKRLVGATQTDVNGRDIVGRDIARISPGEQRLGLKAVR